MPQSCYGATRTHLEAAVWEDLWEFGNLHQGGTSFSATFLCPLNSLCLSSRTDSSDSCT